MYIFTYGKLYFFFIYMQGVESKGNSVYPKFGRVGGNLVNPLNPSNCVELSGNVACYKCCFWTVLETNCHQTVQKVVCMKSQLSFIFELNKSTFVSGMHT